MANSFPYTAYPGVGIPTTFLVGPATNPTRFDVHHWLLAKASPLFITPNGLPRIILCNISLSSIKPDTFHLMKLWILAGELGIWKTQNTVMRLGMALMQPAYFVCNIETVKWVYENTPVKSTLRDYIITIFCQRGPPITPSIFSPAHERLGIFRDAAEFMRKLNLVRAGNPRGIDGYDIHAQFPIQHTWSQGEDELAPVRVRGCLVTGGEDVDWGKIEYPLPSFLVWSTKWGVLPDMHFIREGNVRSVAEDVVKQIEFP
ncbi:hypothetical protein G6011_11319 [Alternaria panax]|uniref:Uncharacterized protein n=1 Tax=Alternaria panax TaxID=48097 RepID=A0AAD4IDJ8_9PLEO|nr:hypothetical protein G6011_11319 [Alternaria panax]